MIRATIVLAALATFVASSSAGAATRCTARPLAQGSGMVKICEVTP